jgi:4-hydroxybutyrate dehydrogenase / sulfolactaldehyde 3-reductase
MGTPMCRRLLANDFATTVFDVSSERMEELGSEGARVADSAAAVAATSDVLVLMLPDSPQVEAVLLGEGGVLSALREGSLIIDMSTIAPATTRRVAALAEAAGSRFIDAPVGRTSRHAEEGDLLIMVGGADDDVDRALPILRCFGKDIIRCGAVGAGGTMKLTNNLLTATIVAANAEALVLGVSAGLELDTVLKVLRMTAASNTHLKNTYAEKALRRDFSPGFATKLAVKDLRLALGLAIDEQLPIGVGSAALQLFSTACGEGHADDDYTSVITVLERLAGVELRENQEVSA